MRLGGEIQGEERDGKKEEGRKEQKKKKVKKEGLKHILNYILRHSRKEFPMISEYMF